jgi:hypothetical protein
VLLWPAMRHRAYNLLHPHIYPCYLLLPLLRRCMKHSAPHARHVKMLVNLRFAGRPYKDPHTFTCAG